LKLDALTKRARYQYGVRFTIQIPPLSSILLILPSSMIVPKAVGGGTYQMYAYESIPLRNLEWI